MLCTFNLSSLVATEKDLYDYFEWLPVVSTAFDVWLKESNGSKKPNVSLP